ncbi:DUF6894 family protein [Methylobacterium flocculans]|uniref:DUF6894 family protein n=1 Tax=Methylobacterium flocculans TaxID=2984843 RepID=UPI0021F2B6D5|nr:hypothetical protein [Methylobacterium sp. FF17]
MPRYFFDIHDGHTEHDIEGTEFSGPEEAVRHAKRILPEIAVHEVPADGEHHAMSVLVTNEDSHPIYSAALSYVGIWLVR